MKQTLALVLMVFGIVGCSTNYDSSANNYYYQPPQLDVSAKDCDEDVCVEIYNYDLKCDENYMSGFEKCDLTIEYRTDSNRDKWDRFGNEDYFYNGNVDIVCKATINVFDFMNQISPKTLSNQTRQSISAYRSLDARSDHSFNFDSFSETNRVFPLAIACGVNDLPLEALSRQQREILDLINKYNL